MRILTEENWAKGDYCAVALIGMTADDLSAALGVEFRDGEEDGLGKTRIQLFQMDDGRQFFLQQYPEAPEPYNRTTEIACLNDPGTMTQNLMDVLATLKLDSGKLVWVSEQVDSTRLKPGTGNNGPAPAP